MGICRNSRQYHREYYQRNKYEICYSLLKERWLKYVERDKKLAGNLASEFMQAYPFEKYQKYCYWYIRRNSVHKDSIMWWECEEAIAAAYMYGIYRCAAKNYTHIDNYIKFVSRRYIIAAIVVAFKENSRPSWDDGRKVKGECTS